MSFLAKTDIMLGTLKRSLGEEMSYRYKTGGSTKITAVWNRQHTSVDPDTEAVVSTNDPNIGVQLKDLRAYPVEGDKVYFNGDKYKVVDVEEDGQGAAQLRLYKL